MPSISSRSRKPAVGVTILLFFATSTAMPRTARAEPITIGMVVFAIGTAVTGAVAADQITSTYVATALGYATPESDAMFTWRAGRQNRALATDVDLDQDGLVHVGQASAEVGYIFDSLDPIAQSKGNYYNAVAIWKNGQVKNSDDAGELPPGSAVGGAAVNVSNLPLINSFKIDMQTGTIGSIQALMGGGAQYVDGAWRRWDPRTETDPTVRAFLSGALLAVAGPGVPPEIPSTDQLFEEFLADGAVDWFPYFLAAASAAGTYERDGQTFVNDFEFIVPFNSPVPAAGDWYHHVGMLAPGAGPGSVVPEPGTIALVGLGLLGLAVVARRRIAQRT